MRITLSDADLKEMVQDYLNKTYKVQENDITSFEWKSIRKPSYQLTAEIEVEYQLPSSQPMDASLSGAYCPTAEDLAQYEKDACETLEDIPEENKAVEAEPWVQRDDDDVVEDDEAVNMAKAEAKLEAELEQAEPVQQESPFRNLPSFTMKESNDSEEKVDVGEDDSSEPAPNPDASPAPRKALFGDIWNK